MRVKISETWNNTLPTWVIVNISFLPRILKHPRSWIMKYYIFLMTKDYVTWWCVKAFVFVPYIHYIVIHYQIQTQLKWCINRWQELSLLAD